MKIKDGNDIITFTGEYGVYESGEPCMSSLSDMIVRVNCGSAEIIG
ncbi:hypothetical protein P19_0254 [Aeromonas phage P19]|uniref:Uncharacterized protein n=2 Tax=Caudoviricetes TaxID=2731619 RepID=A0A291LDY6_9CAUD|nr:hypothetical protein [Aeromonas phage AS-szw]UKM62742.1 hypothetical protein P19_0254 [Aeromonas phage P19]